MIERRKSHQAQNRISTNTHLLPPFLIIQNNRVFKKKSMNDVKLKQNETNIYSSTPKNSLRQNNKKHRYSQSFRSGNAIEQQKYFIDDIMKFFRSKTINIFDYSTKLYRIHFENTLNALKFRQQLQSPNSHEKILISKNNTHCKTIILDLDQTLVHCNQIPTRNSVQLNVTVENGKSIPISINIRPFCKQFLKQLSQIAEIIIFTASHGNYANRVCDYLDPQKKLFSHRLFRQHCIFEKGIFIKDLRILNRNIEDIAIVDNSAFSYCLQMENGIPVLPFYDNLKDKQLIKLLNYLKELVKVPDLRNFNKDYFRLHQYPVRENNMNLSTAPKYN